MSTETVEGYVVDIACIRKYPRSELLVRARTHTTACVLMGHCVESGYALVDGNGLTVLDDHATPVIVALAKKSGKESGIRVRAVREMRSGDAYDTGRRTGLANA